MILCKYMMAGRRLKEVKKPHICPSLYISVYEILLEVHPPHVPNSDICRRGTQRRMVSKDNLSGSSCFMLPC